MRLADPARSKVVLIGAAHYDDANLNDLPSVRNNVLDLQRIFTDPARGGMSETNCHVFADPRSTDVVEIAKLAEKAEDVLLIYYSGHGLIGEKSTLLFALSDTSDRHREINALHLHQLRAIFRTSTARVRVLLLDCCYSGRITDPDYMSSPADLVEIEGTYTLASSARDEVSLAPRGARHTAFSGELISVLQKGISGDEELISLRAIYRELQIRLRKKDFPVPRQLHSETAASLALARNVAHAGDPLSPPREQPWELAARRVRNATIDLTLRVDALDALVACGADATAELAKLAGDRMLPTLLRLRIIHELAGLPGGEDTAAYVLAELVGHTDGRALLRDLRDYLGSLRSDHDFRAVMAAAWDVPKRIDDHLLWGVVMAGLMAAAGMPVKQRLDAVRQLEFLDRRKHVNAILRGMLAERALTTADRVEIKRWLLHTR